MRLPWRFPSRSRLRICQWCLPRLPRGSLCARAGVLRTSHNVSLDMLNACQRMHQFTLRNHSEVHKKRRPECTLNEKILLRNHHSNMKGSSHLLSSPTAAGDSRHVGDVWTHTGAIGDARTKAEKEARETVTFESRCTSSRAHARTVAHTHAPPTPSFSGGPRSVQAHRR